MRRNFDDWFLTFKTSIATWDFYMDFPKVYENVNGIKVELNILNSLIGSKDVENDFRNLIQEYPQILKAIPILLAKREHEINITDINNAYTFNFKNLNQSIDDYCLFMNKTGLFDLLQNHITRDLTDYVKGVEAGLDSNARKNRTGHLMEDLVERFIQEAGFTKNVDYFKEMYKTEIEKQFDIDLSAISNSGKTEKRFDFVIKTPSCIYAIETNFYGSSGSKLNETARSYELLARQSVNIPGFKFIWLTDGLGWVSAKNNLRQTFDIMEDIYNINDLSNGILTKIIK